MYAKCSGLEKSSILTWTAQIGYKYIAWWLQPCLTIFDFMFLSQTHFSNKFKGIAVCCKTINCTNLDKRGFTAHLGL